MLKKIVDFLELVALIGLLAILWVKIPWFKRRPKEQPKELPAEGNVIHLDFKTGKRIEQQPFDPSDIATEDMLLTIRLSSTLACRIDRMRRISCAANNEEVVTAGLRIHEAGLLLEEDGQPLGYYDHDGDWHCVYTQKDE